MISFHRRGRGILMAALVGAIGCGGSSPKTGAGGSGGGAGGGGTGGLNDAAAGTDTGADDGAQTDAASACPVDGAIVVDPFAGVWSGVQGNESYAFTNSGGCSSWTGSIEGMVCDVCTGTYTLTGAATASATLYCRPTGSCSVSPVHTDIGTFTLSGCSITYDYNYGGGSSTVSATRTAETTMNVCPPPDAGTD
jgi:hypothetical protein